MAAHRRRGHELPAGLEFGKQIGAAAPPTEEVARGREARQWRVRGCVCVSVAWEHDESSTAALVGGEWVLSGSAPTGLAVNESWEQWQQQEQQQQQQQRGRSGEPGSGVCVRTSVRTSVYEKLRVDESSRAVLVGCEWVLSGSGPTELTANES